MKKTFKIVLILITLIIGGNLVSDVNALTSDNNVQPRYLEGTNTFYHHASGSVGACHFDAQASVKVGYYQTAAQGAYIKILDIDMDIETENYVVDVYTPTSSPSVGSNVKSGQTVYVSQRVKCRTHGEISVTIGVQIG